MAEEVEVEIRAQFTVEAGENVFVKLRGDALGVIVGGHQDGGVFHQVCAQQQRIAGIQVGCESG